MPLLSALLSAGQTVSNIFGQKSAQEHDEKLASDQRDFNLEMWHKQNSYNHPAAQIARLKEAGLNPRMIYNTGASSAVGTAGDVKGYDRAEARNVMEGIKAFQDFVQFKNIQAQTSNIEAQTDVAKQEALIKAQELISRTNAAEVSISTKEALIKEALNNADITGSRAAEAAADAFVAEETKDVRVEKLKQEFESEIQRYKNMKSADAGQRLMNAIRELELNLNSIGLQKSDNLIFRWLIQSFGIKDQGSFNNFMDTYLKPSKWLKSKDK